MSGEVKTKELISRIESVVGSQRPVPLHAPEFSGNEWQYVKDCLDSGWVSSVGHYVPRFEKMLSEFTGSPFAVVCSNGTSALFMCLKLMGVNFGEEVLVPSLSFVATANAIAHCGALPNFVDINASSLGVDPKKLDIYLKDTLEMREEGAVNRWTGRRVRVLVVVHTFGHPADLEALKVVCEKYRLKMVEDAAEALGSSYGGIHVGRMGVCAALSFNGNKIVTTGAGGAILTENEELGRRAKHLTTTAKVAHEWRFFHDEVGYNLRMANLNAALGCAQLECLPRYLTQKRLLADRYQAVFSDSDTGKVFQELPGRRSNYWLNALILDQASLRDKLLEAANRMGIQVRPAWDLLSLLPMYVDCPRMDLSESENLGARIVNLPSSSNLGSHA